MNKIQRDQFHIDVKKFNLISLNDNLSHLPIIKAGNTRSSEIFPGKLVDYLINEDDFEFNN